MKKRVCLACVVVLIGAALPAHAQNIRKFPDWLQLSTLNYAAPAAADCNEEAEAGRMFWNSDGNVFYLCSGASGWYPFPWSRSGTSLFPTTAGDGVNMGGNLGVGLNATTNATGVSIGTGRSDSGAAYLDLVGDATYTSYGLRIERAGTGANANSGLTHRGTGQLYLYGADASSTVTLYAAGAATAQLTVAGTAITATVPIGIGNGATSAGNVLFYEDTDFGGNAVTLVGPASTDDVTITLPAQAGIVALTQRTVEAVTASKSPADTESGEVYTNEGDADGATITLPTAASGLTFTCYVQTAQTLTVTAGSGDTIRSGASVTAAAGSITSNVVGSAITLVAINATEWVAVASVGTWTF